jgi:hypothetical protein
MLGCGAAARATESQRWDSTCVPGVQGDETRGQGEKLLCGA